MASAISTVKNIFKCKVSPKNNNQSIQRIAIDQSGSIGAYYDAHDDQVLGKLHVIHPGKSIMLDKQVIVEFIKRTQYQVENLLKIVHIDALLRLKILLKMVQPKDITCPIDYSGILNEYTRIICICYESKHELCSRRLIKKAKSEIPPKTATHLINEIVWGVHAAIIVQLPTQSIKKLDNFLIEIKESLANRASRIKWTETERQLVDKIISINCYSNIPDLNRLTKLNDIYERIFEVIENLSEHRPLKYALIPISAVSSTRKTNIMNIDKLDENQTNEIENCLIQLISTMNMFKSQLDHNLPNLLQGNLHEQLNTIRMDFTQLKEYHERHCQSIRDFLIQTHRENESEDTLNDRVNIEIKIPDEIRDYIRKIENSISQLEAKGNLISRLENYNIKYCNVVRLEIQEGDNEQSIKDILFKNDSDKVVFCSSDGLRQKFENQWTQNYTEIVNMRTANTNLSIVYADFSYTTWNLERIIVLRSKEDDINKHNIPGSKGNSDQIQGSSPRSSSLTSDDKYINILLLGESGVGKSTFINALANYLTFGTLKKAQRRKPVVVIPVSFLITVNDDFQEQHVTFGDVDINEFHNISGQSVTQKCKSYILRIAHGKLLRIIDTPGFGDTRGFNQDELNMEAVFSFVNNLEHLNCVCLLFKPNEKELNRYWLSCFKQLIAKFGEHVRDHLCFCFTNSRQTFFMPGDTAPAIISLLRSLSIKDIPFHKMNTFCFDSESFRYLVALKKYVSFNDDDKRDFENSWIRSAKESNRLENFLCNEIKPFRRNIEWQSMDDVQLQIKLMNYVILQTIRNIFQNMILYKMNSSIKLNIINVDQPTTICYTCGRISKQFGQFWLLLDHLHSQPNTCNSNEQTAIQYKLDYVFLNGKVDESIESLKQHENILCKACVQLNSFLRTNPKNQSDLFLLGLTRMISDEEYICRTFEKVNLNQELIVKLKELQTKYQRLVDKTHADKKTQTLTDVYKVMESIRTISMVAIQIDAIKKYQKHILQLQETIIDYNEDSF